MKKQARFAEKHDFSYPLLADPDHRVAEAYGVWQEKRFMGRNFMGIARTTFVIDKEGVVRHVFPKVDIANHPGEVLAIVKELP